MVAMGNQINADQFQSWTTSLLTNKPICIKKGLLQRDADAGAMKQGQIHQSASVHEQVEFKSDSDE